MRLPARQAFFRVRMALIDSPAILCYDVCKRTGGIAMDIQAYLHAYLDSYQPYKSYWNYEDGCVLIGCIDLYRATGDAYWKDFVLRYLDDTVLPDGRIPGFDTKKYNIDAINCGKALFFAWHERGEARFKAAIDFHMERLRSHPRCACGSFWHKESYPNQVWLDGLYMAQPFYMAYEKLFDRYSHVQDITDQFRTVRRQMYSEAKGLSYHAWDEARVQPWCDRATGLSPNFWLRSMGWYLMALVDCIGLSSEELYEHYKTLVDQLRESIRGILRYRDEATGLFYQVIDHPEAEGNYLETSGSAMVAYALLKGVRLGVLDAEKYLPLGRRMFESLVEEKLRRDGGGAMHLCDICKVAGLGPGTQRDGSVAYYLSEPRVEDDSKGVGPFMMAYSEYLLATGEEEA